MVDMVLGHLGLPVISHAEAVKYQGIVNATTQLLLLVEVPAKEYRLKLVGVITINVNVSYLLYLL